jgi:trans-aconitate methyltransferase
MPQGHSEDRREHWNEVYATKPADSVSWYQSVPQLSLDLIGRAELAPDSAIIDIGGGASALAGRLLQKGCRDVTVLDIAATALGVARAGLGEDAERIRWIVADITEWRPERRYDLWHDRAVFHFLTATADRDAYLAALRAGTRAGSQVIIATFAPDGPERCSGLPVQRYAPQELADVLGEDFALVEAGSTQHLTPGGATQQFQFSRFARRR